VCHAFSGNAHAAGLHRADDRHPGWWDDMIGPGKGIDTDRYFVVCSNVIGGCGGSTGPSSVNPETGRPWGLDFPVVTVRDMVEAQRRLVDALGIPRLLAAVGGSMGGMQALQWAASFPDRVRSVIPIATTLKHSPQQIALDEVGRQAVMADPDWNRGDYYGRRGPEKGLALARMIGHITYMSEASMEEKFSRRLRDDRFSFSFATDFEVEGYLRYRGDRFVKRFDANSYLYITKAMDYFDLSGDRLFPGGLSVSTRFLVIGFHSDWLYPLHQSREIVRRLKMRGVETTTCEIRSTYGHDAFLLEIEEEAHLIRHFLARSQEIADAEDA
jgi:homoserine O-acetyltransferase